jgi:ribosomal protein S18 acetylase RimI-like enzyme
MPVTLRPILSTEFLPWFNRSRNEHVNDLMTQGRSREDAQQIADESMDRSFPDGAPGPGDHIFNVVDDSGATVGYLWIGQDVSADPGAWWVWDVLIDPDQRGRGLGRAAMLLGQKYAGSQGAHTLGLSVFGFNTTARSLYESLGYETTSIKMVKKLN